MQIVIEIIGCSVTILLAIGGFYMTVMKFYTAVNVRLKVLEVEIENLKYIYNKQDEKYDKIMERLDLHQESLHLIQLAVQNKQDR